MTDQRALPRAILAPYLQTLECGEFQGVRWLPMRCAYAEHLDSAVGLTGYAVLRARFSCTRWTVGFWEIALEHVLICAYLEI